MALWSDRAGRLLSELIVEFASDRAHLMELQNGILTIIKNHQVLFTEPPPPLQQIGVFPGSRQVAMFSYRLRLTLKEQLDERMLERLRVALSELEVHKVYLS
jgi:hypothetical protein